MVRISRQRSGVLDSQRLGQRIVYATGGNIQICMHGYNGNICLDQSSQQMPQIAVRPQGLQLLLMPADIHQRMVRNDQLTALFLCLGYNCLRNVKRNQKPLHTLFRIPLQMTHIIPRHRKFLRRKAEQRLFNFTYS